MFWLITVQIVLIFYLERPQAERLDVLAKKNNKAKLLPLLSKYASLGLAFGLLKESAGLRRGPDLSGFTFWFE